MLAADESQGLPQLHKEITHTRDQAALKVALSQFRTEGQKIEILGVFE